MTASHADRLSAIAVELAEIASALRGSLPSPAPAEVGEGAPLVVLQGEPLRSSPRAKGIKAITEIVLHESVSASRESTVTTLRTKGYGVHFIVDATSCTQHVAADRYCAHAGVADSHPPSHHNPVSLAVEVVSPCYPPDKPDPGDGVIDAVWMHRGKYLMPRAETLERVWQLVSRLVEEHQGIPVRFPGLDAVKGFRWGRIEKHNEPGISAHARWNHSDGLVPEHYVLCRHLGMSPSGAYARTLEAASCGSRWTSHHLDTSDMEG